MRIGYNNLIDHHPVDAKPLSIHTLKVLTKDYILSQINNLKVQINAVTLLEVTAKYLQKVEFLYLEMDLPHCTQKFHRTFYIYFGKSFLRL